MRAINETELAQLRALTEFAPATFSILRAAEAGLLSAAVPLRRLCELSRLPQAQSAVAQDALCRLRDLGLFESDDGLSWRCCAPPETVGRLAVLLEAIAVYQKEIHQDKDNVTVVLSEPPKPSELADRLDASLRGFDGIVRTPRQFFQMAEGALSRLTVLTPFLDEEATPFVRDLFESSKAARRELIIRLEPGGGYPPGLLMIADTIRAHRVSVLNFRLERPGGGNETFHAKAVLADDVCYVGSFNMTRWSMQYSLELGFAVQGTASRRVADILDAIVEVARPVNL